MLKNYEIRDFIGETSLFLKESYFRYMYCDEVQLEADTVLATLYVAKKYIVPHLARACVNYLETSLTAKNACLLLSQSRLFEEPDLMQRCWEVIDAQVSNNQKVLSTITLNTSLDMMVDESNFLSDHDYHIRHFYSYEDVCIKDKFKKSQYERNHQKKLRINDTRESSKSRISLAPHCLSLSEIKCYSSAIDINKERLPYTLFRTRSEPYFPGNKLDIEITQNMMYRDSFIEDYECMKHTVNVNDLSDSRYSNNHDLSKIVVKSNGVIM